MLGQPAGVQPQQMAWHHGHDDDAAGTAESDGSTWWICWSGASDRSRWWLGEAPSMPDVCPTGAVGRCYYIAERFVSHQGVWYEPGQGRTRPRTRGGDAMGSCAQPQPGQQTRVFIRCAERGAMIASSKVAIFPPTR